MATLTALNKIPKKYLSLATGFIKINTNNNVNIPQMIKYLFLAFYTESDEWMPNNLFKLSNQNKTVLHVKKKNNYSYIYGTVQMKGFQSENIIYQWCIRIDRCINQSICIGLMNTEYITTLDADKQWYYAYVATAPFRVWFTNMEKSKCKFLTASDMAQIKRIMNQDVIKIQVIFTKGEQTKIIFSNNNAVLMTYSGIKEQYTYQLYICMGSQYDKATITDFKTICFR